MSSIKGRMQHVLYTKYKKGKGHSKRAERSKHEDRKSPNIHSRSTLTDYLDEAGRYGDWLAARGEKNADLERARELAPEYIREQGTGRSAWSQNLTRSALAKVFGCKSSELGEVARRDCRDIKRGRDRDRDKHLGPKREADREICRATGLRHYREVPQLTPRACCFGQDGHIAYVHIIGKGGRVRDTFVLPGPGRDLLEARYRAADDPDAPLLGALSGVNVHAARADYAARAYEYALQNGMGNGNMYEPAHAPCGSWDRGALDVVSSWMGHGAGRYDTIVYNYLSYGK